MVFCRRNCGFARVPYHAPIPCHMHTFLNCHHIQSCYPPVKQYIPTHHTTEFIYPFTIFYFKVAMARAALCFVCALYTAWRRQEAWQQTFRREWVQHGETGRDAVECCEKGGCQWNWRKGLQHCGQTSSVVWCRALGNNKGTRSTTRSKWDEDAEMDVRNDKEG